MWMTLMPGDKKPHQPPTYYKNTSLDLVRIQAAAAEIMVRGVLVNALLILGGLMAVTSSNATFLGERLPGVAAAGVGGVGLVCAGGEVLLWGSRAYDREKKMKLNRQFTQNLSIFYQ